MPPKSHQQYTSEQKQQAVRIARESGKSVTQLAKNLGICQTTLSRSLPPVPD
ncbi:transposase IS3/IS911 family protein [Gloeobacter kilaueensis JS1]|uniref:Transposase IS3/IS911 family protein n=1 Tax=Gloeobacter kilaueensis (strain ATCC BAA-2537 / CCAP 1431/1 / ULC 316 / JS1) TaxID=1183438 RepID=U5QEH8_GLOK1|nr:transposase IS3/IS911 family protein [Gloeobacter kilaueensis JS1]